MMNTEVCAKSPAQGLVIALTLSSESGPQKSWRVQDFWCRPPYIVPRYVVFLRGCVAKKRAYADDNNLTRLQVGGIIVNEVCGARGSVGHPHMR